MTPTREIPSISLNDINVSKHRGNYQAPKKVQVKSGELQRPISQKSGNIELKMSVLPSTQSTQKISTPDITNVKPLVNPRKGDYMLNRTQSTGGIAAKISLELKKRYLLDTSAMGNIQRSGSATALDSKLKSFHSNISEHQKLLNPAPEISPTMQAFLQGTSKLHTPLSPSITPKSPTFCLENKLQQIISEENEKKIEKNEKDKKLQSPEIIDLTLSPNDKFSMQPDITKDILIEDIEEKCDSIKEYQPDVIYTNDTEGRPRSPVHETSIIVPEISWKELNKPEKKSETDIDTDSLTSENSDVPEKPGKVFSHIPRVEIHDSSGELLPDDMTMDSLCIIPEKSEESNKSIPSIVSEPPKSILSEKKTLNQPKPLPVIENGFDKKCHIENKEIIEIKDELKSESGRSTPISISDPGLNDNTAANLTETELSDWARDGAVSDDLEDVEFDIGNKKLKSSKRKSVPKTNAKIAMGEDFEDHHICGKNAPLNKMPSTNGVPIADFDSIEFMDTGSEISCDDVVQTTNTTLQNRGYVQFVNDEEQKPKETVVETINSVLQNRGYIDSNESKIVNSPNNNEIIEAINENFKSDQQNTGYCVFDDDDSGNFGSKVIDLKPTDLEKEISCDNEEDSLLNIDTGTTTEDNTCSDSTVKNMNEEKEKILALDKEENKNEEDIQTPVIEEQNGLEYNEHVKRLQMKYAEFGFVRDSIDVRKSKRKSKSQSPPSHSEISEVKEPTSPKEVPVSPTFTSPITSKKLDEINKERNKQKDLIHDLVMDKVKTQRRSLDKRRKLRDSFSTSPSNSPVRTSFDLTKSATVSSVLTDNNTKNLSLSFDSYKPKEKSPITLQKSPTVIGIPETTDEKENKLSHLISQSKTSDEIFNSKRTLLRPLSVNEPYSRFKSAVKEPTILPDTPLTNPEAFSLPDIHQVSEFKTPVAPPRIKHDDAKRTAEKLKQEAKVRARLMSDEELGLSPEDKMNIYRQMQKGDKKQNSIEDVQDSIETLVLKTDKRNATKKKSVENLKKEGELLHNSFSSNDITNNKLSLFSDGSIDALDTRNRTKSVSELSKSFNKSVDEEELKKSLSGNIITESQRAKLQFYKSDPNLLTDAGKKEKKSKDRERRKSIIKSVTDFFHKKKDVNVKSPNSTSSGSVKDRFARFRISPKSKEKSKVSHLNLLKNCKVCSCY